MTTKEESFSSESVANHVCAVKGHSIGYIAGRGIGEIFMCSQCGMTVEKIRGDADASTQ